MMEKLIAQTKGRSRVFLAALAAAASLLLALSAGASAEVTFNSSFGSAGSGAGQFSEPAGIAQNRATGNVYIADRANHRIQVFNEAGIFREAWGFDVVESGVDNRPFVNEEQRITVRAVDGTFTLTFGGDTTTPLAYNAGAEAVENALNALPSISGEGTVDVTGGPGDATGTNPYVVTFNGGSLQLVSHEEIQIDRSQLAMPVGTQLSCRGTAYYASIEGHYNFQWLRNGQPISGATSATYTTTEADNGKAIQCEAEAVYENTPPFPVSWDTNREYTLIGTTPSPAPPLGPQNVAEPSGPPLPSPGPGGTLTCNAGEWQGSPTSYTYQWFLHNVAITEPVTKAGTSDEITLSEADVAARGLIQCKVTATNAGGSSTMWSDIRQTVPGPAFGGLYGYEEAAPEVTFPNNTTRVSTKRNGGAVFETCKAGTNDICKSGVAGPSMGQFSQPRGVAVDNSPGGNGAVYVGDDKNYRVQKLAENGAPIFEIGKGVDQTTGGNVCVVADGHDCFGARIAEDQTPSTFGGWPCYGDCAFARFFGFDELGNTVAVDQNTGRLYVTDPYEVGGLPWEGRVQAFDSSGQFIGQNQPPQFGPEPIDITSIGVDFEGRVLENVTMNARGTVDIFDPSEFTPEGTKRGYAERDEIDAEQNAKDVTGDPTSDKIWIVDRNESDFAYSGAQPPNHRCAGETNEATPRRALVAYDHLGHELDCTVPQGPAAITSASGLLVTDSGLAFVPMKKNNIVKVFNLPQETAPSARGGFADRITPKSAQLHAEAAPGFEPTEWGFEYGTEPCSSSTCQKVTSPTKVYGLKFQPVELALEGIEPGTKYYYRLFATNPVGSVSGPEHTFRTYPFLDLRNDQCGNALARKQTKTAALLDCRAYELASAGFTGGYDVISDLAPGQTPFEGFPAAGDKVLYSVKDGGIPGTGKPTNLGPDPYVAVRDAGAEKWITSYVGIPSDSAPSKEPFASRPIGADGGLNAFAFGGPDICDPCFGDESSGIPVRLPDGRIVQGMTGSNPHPEAVPAGYVAAPMSANGTHLVFGTTSQLEDEGNNNGDVTIYDRNLSTATTQVVSTDDDGNTLTGPGIGELGVSNDGSRIVVGKRISTDAEGNMRWQLYMHVGGSDESVDLTPGTTTGVLYDGMSADGGTVFFSTRDKLASADTDASADIYKAVVSGTGSITPELVSVGPGGSPSNDDGCDPIGNPNDWNVISGSGKCDAVGLAGGAGVAQDGTVYFLSPELLAGGGSGEADAANLYVVRSGSDEPDFVATIDGPAQKPTPPPNHPVVNNNLISGLSNPEDLAVDQSNGDIYVAEIDSNSVSRYTAAGAAKNFTTGPGSGTNEIGGQNFTSQGKGAVAVDSSNSVMAGSFYTSTLGSTVKVYANSGAELGTLTGFNESCGVTVDNSTGAVYVADPKNSTLWRFAPTSAPSPGVSNSNYSVTKLTIVGQLCHLSADSDGHVYASAYPNGPARRFNASDFSPSGPLREGSTVTTAGVPPSHLTYVDPSTNELYVNTGTKIVIFDAEGNKLKEFGAGSISGYGGVAVNGGEGAGQSSRAHHVYAVNGSTVVEFGIEADTYEPVDDPAIVHAVNDNEIHHWRDFQTSANGRYALLSTTERSPNPGYDNGRFRMVYRYDAASRELSCASCISTEGLPSGDAALPSHGLGISDTGLAFFNSTDGLVLRDTNKKLDAYEWSPFRPGVGGCDEEIGCQALISTGFSNAASSLLTVTNDGTDAFFFTREVLVNDDHNGETMKVYDARANGGFFKLPASPPCAAADECHGPSSQAAPAPAIGTHDEGGGNARPLCRKRFVMRHGRCVKKPRKHRRKHRKHRKRHKKNHHRAAGHGKGGSR